MTKKCRFCEQKARLKYDWGRGEGIFICTSSSCKSKARKAVRWRGEFKKIEKKKAKEKINDPVINV